jgi:cytosine/creatinine deaminase
VSWLVGATLDDGRVVDVEIADATIRAVVHHDGTRAPDSTVQTDLRGMLLLSAPAEPHAHLDKALTASEVPNPRGDLLGAIEAWTPYIPKLTVAGMAARAEEAALELVAAGVTAVRTHVNVHVGVETKATEALLAVRDRIGHLIDIQIVALCGWVTGPDGDITRDLLRATLGLDPSIIVGGCPHLDADPIRATDIALEMAGEFGRPLDLHTDETLDPAHLELRYLAERVIATGFSHGAVASHCVSLGMQTPAVQREVSELVAAAGIGVVTLPQTNLFLQAREIEVAPPRGLTALRPLLDAKAVLGAGADNVRDPFNSMGRSDPFETAALLVMAGHLLPHEAWELVTTGARRCMGLAPVTIAPGQPAELVAVRGNDLADAMARADQQRIVWHRGREVARTTVDRRIGTVTDARTPSQDQIPPHEQPHLLSGAPLS